MFSLEKVMVVVANLVVVVVKACVQCMNHHVLQEGSKEWNNQREDEEVSMVDGVFEGAFGEFGLEMEALLDTMEVYGG
nr:hypothetical protein [Tanacetum cinerariifolium]